MIKQVMMVALLAVPYAYADWIDDITQFVENGTLDQLRAENAVQKYIDKDIQGIQRLEKKAEANDEDGFWATVRGGTYQLQWAAANASLRYHKKVLTFIKGLPKNERDRVRLIEHLAELNKNRKELQDLKDAFSKSSGWSNSFKAGGLVAAKQVQIKGRKALIKSISVM